MNKLINQYIEDKRLAWAPSTLRSEEARLRAVLHLLDGNPLSLWNDINVNLASYSKVTTWTRVVDFWSFIHPNEVNPYEIFRKKNSRLFKYAYIPKRLGYTFREAIERIKRIENIQDRQLAIQILSSGERYKEAVQEGEVVIGKGSKPRAVYRSEIKTSFCLRSYSSFNRSLRKVDLSAHALRKLCASRLVEEGLKEADLCQVMGWSSILTAKAYLQPKKEEELKSIFNKLHEELL